VKYLRGILVGAAVSALTVIIFSVTSVVLMSQFPESVARILSAQKHELGWGEFYAADFPLWPVVTVGVIAFAITFVLTLRRASA